MKKLLLSIATVALAGSFAMADNVTVNFSDETTAAQLPTAESATPSTAKINGVDFEFMNCKKGKYEGAMYLQISAKKVTPMGYLAFTLPDNCTKFTITTGENASTNVTVNVTAGSNKIKENVVLDQKGADFAFEIPADYQDAGTKYTLQVTNKYNAQITKIVFETEQGGSSTLTPAGLSFPEGSYTAVIGQAFTAPELSKTTDAVAVYTSSNPEVATVDAATGAVTLVAAGETTIKATTPETATYRAGEASYKLTVLDLYTSIEDFYSAGDGNTGVIDFPLTVAYQNGINTYATDGTDFTLIYGEMPSYEVGDVIPSGWIAQYKQYYNVPEIIPVSEPAESQEIVEFKPAVVESIDASLLNHIVILVGVDFAEDTPAEEKTNFTGTVNGTEYAFRTTFAGVGSVAAGKYNVRVAVSDFKGAIQLLPIKYDEYSGVDEITVAEGEALYYNMQGVRVANPENGMFIRVQNGKAQKVVIK